MGDDWRNTDVSDLVDEMCDGIDQWQHDFLEHMCKLAGHDETIALDKILDSIAAFVAVGYMPDDSGIERILQKLGMRIMEASLSRDHQMVYYTEYDVPKA